ncbi:hypothetical protein EXIGLDRAFT_724082 [Exidia glandulosa HHB12029]|uniref:ER lumen protein retaining receptor n=1 Tax=Exidia glandulosa HHB12029 TaxID=1314781 RepID=A0A165EK84_EXIGL|nr:hypothetical protein EXIGLDRAFT_724082 [Exidia glandulosa HHB12029]
MNIFRILGDFAHFTSKCILIWAIHSNKSAEGVSLYTQAMYALVFVTRYLDLFWSWISFYNTFMKLFYLASSFYIVAVMIWMFPHSQESAAARRTTLLILVAAFAVAFVLGLVPFWGSYPSFFNYIAETVWSFSIVLEAFCVVPQLILLRQTTVPTVINSFYLVALGSYRGLYILNWFYRAAFDNFFDPIAFVFGIIQTALYLDFAWVYYRRQRVKLRNGAIVDSEDFERGWFSRWMVGKDGAVPLVDAEGQAILVPEQPHEGRIALPPDVEHSQGDALHVDSDSQPDNHPRT